MTAQRDTPCKCGWKFLTFHICVDLTGDTPQTPFPKRKRKISDRHREAIGQSQTERWERHHEANRARDEKIVERYKSGGIGTSKIAKEFGMARSSVLKVLQRAQDAGLVKVRSPGTTLAKGAK